MNSILRLTICVAAMAGAALGLDQLHPGGLRQFAADLGQMPELRESVRFEAERHEELQAHITSIIERVASKEQIARELVAERVTLLEAAARFRDIEAATPESERTYSQAYRKNCSDATHYCRQVIAYTKAELLPQPKLAAAVVARLERELQEELDCGGISLR